MKIVSPSSLSPSPVSAEAMQALKIELERLKEEVMQLRANAVQPVVIPAQDQHLEPTHPELHQEVPHQETPHQEPPHAEEPHQALQQKAPQPEQHPEQPVAPVAQRSPQDPLFAQLWAYINHEK